MNFEEYIFNQKELIGKILFLISIIFFVSMFIISLTGVYIFIDERFTLNLIQSSLNDAIKLCLADVHPPLYYMLLKIPCIILSAWDINYNAIIVSRIMSIIPYLIILLISLTKLKKEYGWFTIGLFTFTIATMSGFYMQFVTMRMYNWGILFIILSFIYLKDVIEKSDAKSWILFTLFTLLGGYTQYVILIPSAILYLGLLIHYLLNNKKTEIKKWILSSISVIILYAPWIFVFSSQFYAEETRRAAVSSSLKEIVNSFSRYAIENTAFDFTGIVLKIIVLFILIYFIRWILARYLTNRDDCNSYMLIGILTPTLTILGSIIAFSFIYKSVELRYLIPAYSLIWITISIYLGIQNKKRAFTVLLLAILLIGCFNTIDFANTLNEDISNGYKEQTLIDEINNPNSIIVYTHRFAYLMYSYDLDNTVGYTTKYVNPLVTGYDVVSQNLTIADIDMLAKEHPDKQVYRIGPVVKKDQAKIPEQNKVFNRGNWMIVKVS